MKGAERKTRDEERRAAKRKMTATGRKKLDELYHPVTDRSEFYGMQDINKPPVLFVPAEDIDKVCVNHHINQSIKLIFLIYFFSNSFQEWNYKDSMDMIQIHYPVQQMAV